MIPPKLADPPLAASLPKSSSNKRTADLLSPAMPRNGSVMDFDGASKRQYERVDSLGTCFAVLGEGWEGSVVNLSQGGLLLRLKRPLTEGASYYLKLLLEQHDIVVLAKVARLAQGDDQYEIGMEFINMSQQDRRILREQTSQ